MPDFKTYRLATPEDWATVPPEDLHDALIDFGGWQTLMHLCGLVEKWTFGLVKLVPKNAVFTWVNDGAHHTQVRVVTGPKDTPVATVTWEGKGTKNV